MDRRKFIVGLGATAGLAAVSIPAGRLCLAPTVVASRRLPDITFTLKADSTAIAEAVEKMIAAIDAEMRARGLSDEPKHLFNSDRLPRSRGITGHIIV